MNRLLDRLGRPGRWFVAGVGAVGAWVVLDHVLARGAPLGIVVVGIVLGWRANKVVNFAQAEFGAVAAVLAIEFVLRLHMNYFLAVASGLVIALVLGGLV